MAMWRPLTQAHCHRPPSYSNRYIIVFGPLYFAMVIELMLDFRYDFFHTWFSKGQYTESLIYIYIDFDKSSRFTTRSSQQGICIFLVVVMSFYHATCDLFESHYARFSMCTSVYIFLINSYRNWSVLKARTELKVKLMLTKTPTLHWFNDTYICIYNRCEIIKGVQKLWFIINLSQQR